MCKKSVLCVLLFGIFALVLARESSSQAPTNPQPLAIDAPPAILVPRPSTEPARLIPIPQATQGQINDSPKKLVNIWSMQMGQADGRNIVLATIGKRSAIKIMCDSVDFQTHKGMMQAQGNVEISGDEIRCSCEQLTIFLHEDRLELASKARVEFLKQNAPQGKGAGKEAILEMQGERLSLRWLDVPTKSQPNAAVLPGRPYDPRDTVIEPKEKLADFIEKK